MKYFLVVCFSTLFFTTHFAQKMLESGEWCGHKGTVPPMPALLAEDFRSDSVDILHTEIDIDITDFTNTKISSHAAIHFKTKMTGVVQLRLDLLQLTVDSVHLNTGGFTWNYNTQQIVIQPVNGFDTSAVYTAHIYYRGKPALDASGWGGFYWQSGYAYNLGVGFAADPHNYGRIWFPCFDQFTERCTYTIRVTSPADKKAFANGALTSDTLLSNGLRHSTWVLDQPVPSYLTCVAVGPFTSWESTIAGENGNIPVQIAVAASDTNKLKSSFIHLPEAVAAFEYWYGPYRWNKVGYSMVPFNSGAMEHATNIAYMRSAVDGTVNSETLMAHELSHHWWGDLATCSTAEDMWLNEGWASFSEHLFLEKVYGYDRYIQTVLANYYNVLENAHILEGGYRAVSGVPHNLTYGEHVYHKGAVVAHALRGYMDDETFRTGLRKVMEETQFTDFSSADFRDKMSDATGINLTSFFDNWVYAPGFVDFTIDSVTTSFDDLLMETNVNVFVKQRLRGAPDFYNNVPLEFTFQGLDNTPVYKQAMVSGEQTQVTFKFGDVVEVVSYIPYLNTRQRIPQARVIDERDLPATGTVYMTPVKTEVKVNAAGSTTPHIRTEYHYSMPDTAGIATTADMTLTNRFWVVEPQLADDFSGTMTLFYDGRGQMDQLDRELFLATSNKEDSIRLFYRPQPGVPWQEHPDYTKNVLGNMSDKWGFLKANKILAGEYTIGKSAGTSAIKEVLGQTTFTCTVSPNPTTGLLQVLTDETPEKMWLVNQNGTTVLEQNGNAKTLDIKTLPAGTYHLILFTGSGKTGTCTVVKAGH